MGARHKILPVVFGPTGVGKTNISIEVAQKLGAEIVSCDSRQVYQYMDIGTGKPTKEELAKVKHWLIDVIPPDETLNAWEYAQIARAKIREIWDRGKTVIVVGGAGLYLRALIDGFFKMPSSDRSVRERLHIESITSLYKKLSEVDKDTADKLHSNDKVRIIRALEVYEITGIPISVLKAQRLPFDCTPIYIGLNMPRPILYKKIDERVAQMKSAGLLQEVKTLLQIYPPTLNSFQTIGYQELISYLQGKLSLNEAVRLIKRNTRRYAKRQLTWFRSIKGVQWIELPDPQATLKCLNLVNQWQV